MSRINRIARALVAVRPFPLTDQMKQIINSCCERLWWIATHGQLREKNDLYDKDIQVRGRSVTLLIWFNEDPTFGRQGITRVYKGGDLFTITVNFPLGQKASIQDFLKYVSDNWLDFWVWFRRVLHHELIHVFDPKMSDSSLMEKISKSHGFNREDISRELTPGMLKSYYKSPVEKSAFQGHEYYWFKHYALEDMDMNDAVRGFFARKLSDVDYVSVMKGLGAKEWKDYKTRIYKSAKQAYEDVAKERQ